MNVYIRPLALLSLLFGSALLATPAHAQFWDRIKDAAKDAAADAVESEVREKSADAVHGAFDVAENAVRCAVSDQACIDQAQAQGKPVVVTDAQGNVVKQIPGAGAKAASGAQGMGAVSANYDFKPGERTLFATDFSDAVVGNFPRKLEFQGGSMSIVAYQGGRALRVKTDGAFAIHLPEKLPKRFTLEFKAYTSNYLNNFRVMVVDAEGKPVGTHYIKVDSYDGIGVNSFQRGGISALQPLDIIEKRMMPIRVMVDGSYVKVYVGKTRVANMPNADLGRSNTLRFYFQDVRDYPIYVADIRVAAGGRDLYAALTAEGRVAVQDIQFATGSASITPASAEAISAIATLLKEHPDLRLLIEGHTSSTGGFETNMSLSKERAAAVKTALVERHGIDAGRLKTMGLGATQPTASNDTAEGRAENRRVEIVKL